MRIRNFYMRGIVDGRKTDIGFGPSGNDGEMSLELLIRNNGYAESLLKIDCFVNTEGKLVVRVIERETQNIIYEAVRER